MVVKIDAQSSNVGIPPVRGGEPASSNQVIAEARVQQLPEEDGLPIEGRTLLEQQSQVVRQAGLDLNQTEQIDAAFNNLTPELRAQLKSVGAQYVGMVNSGDNILNSNSGDALQSRWSDFISNTNLKGGAVDVNSLVQWVLRESYQETTKDLYFYAEKVKYFNSCKKAIRDELSKAREFMAEHGVGLEEDQTLGKTYDNDGNATGGSAQSWQGKGISGDFTGSDTDPTMDPALYKGAALTTKGGLDTYIQNLEEKLSSVGDDAQLANVDLQNILQKQQQTIQMMSNISKMLHDTAQAIIRKIGG